MLEKIKQFAINIHIDVNHKYGVYPYPYHLSMVVEEAQSMIYEIHPDNQEDVLCACWLHDTIEDCRLTYNDIVKVSNEKVADIVYAVSNEKGKNRQERANEKYYQGIRETPYATFVKLCDRIANVKHSKKEKSRMFDIYQKEHQHFIDCLFENEFPTKTFDIIALKKLNYLFLEQTHTHQ